MRTLRITIIATLLLISMITIAFGDSGNSGNYIHTQKQLQELNDEQKSIVINDLGIKEDTLSEDEMISLLTTGNATIWNKSYNSEYNIKKSFSMTASLSYNNGKPYTKFTVTNNGKNTITVIAYKGSVGGSTTIKTMTVAAGNTKTMTVTRSDVVQYGNINGQGTAVTLPYTVSMYNTGGKNISCKVKAVRYY